MMMERMAAMLVTPLFGRFGYYENYNPVPLYEYKPFEKLTAKINFNLNQKHQPDAKMNQTKLINKPSSISPIKSQNSSKSGRRISLQPIKTFKLFKS